jgi:hypothetical protein
MKKASRAANHLIGTPLRIGARLRKCEIAWQDGNIVGLKKAIQLCADFKVPSPAWINGAKKSVLIDLIRAGTSKKKIGRHARAATKAREDENDYIRWDAVKELRARKKELQDLAGIKPTWEEAYERAAEYLKSIGSPAKGSASTMKASYQRVAKNMREGKRGRYLLG